MASLFKPWITYYILEGRRVKKGTPGADKIKERAGVWYGQYRVADGTRKRVPLGTDKGAAQFKLAELVRNVDRQRHGYADPFEAHGKRKLSEQLAEFRDHLVANANSPDYIAETVHRIELVLKGCGFDRLRDLQGAKVDRWLANKRAADNSSPSTLNGYLTAVKGFCQWLADEDRIRKSPLDHLSRQNTEVDRCRERRHATAEEFAWLIETTGNSPKPFYRLEGPDRAMLYTVAAYTGLRASELASLTRQSLTLGSDPPILTVQAAYSKHRRKDLQPMPAWVATRLSAWLAQHGPAPQQVAFPFSGSQAHGTAARDAEEKLWQGSWRPRAAEMMEMDLAAARAEWIGQAATPDERSEREGSDFLAYWNKAGHVFDFHALRHQFTSNLAAAGVHPKTAQQLARHSTITLTMDRYTHLAVADVAGALDRLPEPAPITQKRQEAMATGTAGRLPVPGLHTPDLAPPGGFSGNSVASSGTERATKRGNTPSAIVPSNTQETLRKRGISRAEGKGVEPSTGCPAPDFELVPSGIFPD